MRIYLIGFMGCGKSTVGKKLSRLMNYDFIDLDTQIENKYQFNIPAIFERFDEKAFRTLERECLMSTLRNNNCIIATGGGTACFFENMKWMNTHGLTVYLQMQPESLYARLLSSRKKRPLIEQRAKDEVLQYIRAELESRHKYYQQANLIINVKDLKIQDLIRSLKTSVNQ